MILDYLLVALLSTSCTSNCLLNGSKKTQESLSLRRGALFVFSTDLNPLVSIITTKEIAKRQPHAQQKGSVAFSTHEHKEGVIQVEVNFREMILE